MDHAKRPRRSTEADEKTIEEKEKVIEEQKELTREQRNLTRILAKRSMDNLSQQEFIRLSTGCSMILAAMAEGAQARLNHQEQAEVVLVIKTLGVCANFMNHVALKMNEKLKEEMDGRLIVTHLPEEGMYLYVREKADGCGILQEFGCCLLFRQNSDQRS